MEPKKTRRRPNFFDILFVLLIVAVAAAAYLLSHNGSSQANTVRRAYVVEMNGLQEGMEDYVAPGDAVTDNVKNYDIGTVTKVEVIPYTIPVLDEEAGVLRQVPVEGQISLHLTIEADTVETDNSINTVSGYTLRTGVAVSCTAGQLSSAGHILSVQREEAVQ